MRKIAFCFIVYDVLECEEVWYEFLKNVDPSLYNIYIHPKAELKSKYFEYHQICQSKRIKNTKWGDVSLVKAQNALLETALEDIENEHFVFLSQACIPLKSFQHIYERLDAKYSYFNMCSWEDCFPRCNKALKFIDKHIIQKAHQWCILNKKHAKLMMESDEYLKWFDDKATVPDEHAYISNLYYHKLQGELVITCDKSLEATTFTCWLDGKIKEYKDISVEEQEKLLQAGCYFGRKFKKQSEKCLREYLCEKIS